jgi:hypothetical protein
LQRRRANFKTTEKDRIALQRFATKQTRIALNPRALRDFFVGLLPKTSYTIIISRKMKIFNTETTPFVPKTQKHTLVLTPAL